MLARLNIILVVGDCDSTAQYFAWILSFVDPPSDLEPCLYLCAAWLDFQPTELWIRYEWFSVWCYLCSGKCYCSVVSKVKMFVVSDAQRIILQLLWCMILPKRPLDFVSASWSFCMCFLNFELLYQRFGFTGSLDDEMSSQLNSDLKHW